jgi:hypothetical protein
MNRGAVDQMITDGAGVLVDEAAGRLNLLEQELVAHQSPRTTKLYDRTKDEISLDEVERIKF